VDRRLLAIRLRRRHILIELCPVLTAPASLAFIEMRLPTDSAIAPAVFAIALVLYLAASTRFCLHFFAVLKEACPRCSGFFFVSWRRFLYTLPYLAPSCAHCGLSLRRQKRPA
jgi:hypothetical protein